nr:hypothetical protein TetV2_00505 [Oceanusvirus sp.]
MQNLWVASLLLVVAVVLLALFTGCKEGFNPGPYVIAVREACESGDEHACRTLCKDMNQIDVCQNMCAKGHQDMCRHGARYTIPRHWNQEARYEAERKAGLAARRRGERGV